MFSLMKALLNKNSEEALFWSYEIYYSGFKEEIIVYLMQIYYDFYASHNKDIHNFLLSLVKDWQKNNLKHWIVGAIVENLVHHDSYTDSFTLQKMKNKANYKNKLVKQDKIYPEMLKIMEWTNDEEIINWFNENHDADIVDLINQIKNNIDSMVDAFIRIKSIDFIPLIKSVTMAYLFSYMCENKNTNKICLVLDNDMISLYKTPIHIPNHCNRVLCKARLYQTTVDYSDTFVFSRKNQTMEEYYDMLRYWLFYASYSPIWSQRIHKYNGIIDYDKKTVEFHDDNDMEEFYSYYAYDLDEENTAFRPPPPDTFSNDGDLNILIPTCKRLKIKIICDKTDIL